MVYDPVVNRVLPEHPKLQLVFVNIREPLGNQVASELRINATPTSVILDREHREQLRFQGARSEAQLGKILANNGF